MARLRKPRQVTALSVVAALLLAGCGGGDPTVEVEPTEDATPEEPETEEPEAPTEPDDDGTDDDGGTDDGDDGEASVGPTPDPALVNDPCAPDQGREEEGFITVVSPVADQLVTGDSVDLVGCSNVFEANVQWSLYDGDGRELDTGFTTAECGSGCVGAFEEEISLEPAEGEPYAELHVYSEDMAGEQGRMFLVEVPLILS